MLFNLFDLSNLILGSLILSQHTGQKALIHPTLGRILHALSHFKATFGGISFFLGLYFLLNHPYCIVHDLTGITIGLLTLGRLNLVPFPATTTKLTTTLSRFAYPIGMMGMLVGILGLWNIHWLCGFK